MEISETRYKRDVDVCGKLAFMRASTRKITHPALALFAKLFAEAEASGTICNPTGFVHVSYFQDKLAAAGIDHPKGFIQFADWYEEIGVDKLAHRLVTAYHRKHGTRRTVTESASWRFHQRRARENWAA